MQIIRKRNSYFIEVTKKFLWFKWKSLLTYSIVEPSFAEDCTEYHEREYLYRFPSYSDAKIFLNWINR